MNNNPQAEMGTRKGLRERVHLIPLGHEIDRAVKPFTISNADRAYVITVPDTAHLERVMLEKQRHFTEKVCEGLTRARVIPTVLYCNMFDILEVLRVISSLIVKEKQKDNEIYVNMSACGRKTSVAVTIAAMIHKVQVYYVSADHYATGENAAQEDEHGLSIVDNVRVETFFNFEIMMPDQDSLKLLSALYDHPAGMRSRDLFIYFHQIGVDGYEELPSEKKGDFVSGRKSRELLNRTNRNYLYKLEEAGYIKREWKNRNFIITITNSGRFIACASGLLGEKV